MSRRLSVGVGVGVVAVAALIVWRGTAPRANAASPAALALSASALDAGSIRAEFGSLANAAGLANAAATAPSSSSSSSSASDNVAQLPEFAPGTRLADGSPVPPLPEISPKTVKFGVVLVAYRGAQGAPKIARTRADALEIAKKLAIEAKADFAAAVAQGDSGSVKDLGRVPRGVLEPAPEYALFTMKAGSVSDPIDTPRGFWIVKRTE